LLEALIERAEEVEPKVNAFSFRHFDQALDQAKRAEARFMKSGDDIRPLEGLPIAVKDAAYIKGLPTSSASLTMRDFVPDRTSVHVERILAGGFILG
jgi:Asp-tRNA(Asn)/Glu-tRNA(Gln) amidotransferase A subunit family amidase